MNERDEMGAWWCEEKGDNINGYGHGVHVIGMDAWRE